MARLAERQAQPVTAQDVEVQVIDALARVRPHVRQHAVAGLGDAGLARYPRRHLQAAAEQSGIDVFGLAQRGNMLIGDDQDVHARLRANVPEGCYQVVLMDDAGLLPPGRDLAEHAPGRRHDTPFLARPTAQEHAMPELPEVEVVRRSLEPPLRGSRIIRILAGQHPGDILTLPLEEFAREVEGQRIVGLGRRGKTLLIELDSGATITVHLGMTGELSLARPGEPYPSHHHLSFVLDQGRELRYRDIRRFGRIGLLRPGERDQLEARLGPEPLAPELTPERLRERLARHRRAIKALLLEQSFLAGVGNIYADEALFRAGIHPLRPASSLDIEEARRLLEALREVLEAAIYRRGTTIRNYRDGLGQPGENQASLRIYGRPPGSPCPVCGTPVERVVVVQRGTTFCPRCQPFLPTTAASRSGSSGSSGSSTG